MPSKSKVLAKFGDPLVTKDGRVISPEGEKVIPDIRPDVKPSEFTPTKRRTLKELPGESNIITAVGAVIVFTVLGVGDREICTALNIDMVKLKYLREHAAYAECFNILVSEFINANSSLVAARIAAYSHTALTSLAEVTLHGQKEDNRLRGAINLLDRGGHGPKDVINRQGQRDELRITLIGQEQELSIEINGGRDG